MNHGIGHLEIMLIEYIMYGIALVMWLCLLAVITIWVGDNL